MHPGECAITSLLFLEKSQNWVVIHVLTFLDRFFVGAWMWYLPEFGSRVRDMPLGIVGSLLEQIAFHRNETELKLDFFCER